MGESRCRGSPLKGRPEQGAERAGSGWGRAEAEADLVHNPGELERGDLCGGTNGCAEAGREKRG